MGNCVLLFYDDDHRVQEKVNNIETFYLIDYENVNSEGLTGCDKLKSTDHIVIFFTKNAMKIDMSKIANHGEADLDMIEVSAGKQSTDIHIGSYLGYLAAKYEMEKAAGDAKGEGSPTWNVVIISADTDFDKVMKFWADNTGIGASRAQKISNSISNGSVKKETPASQKASASKGKGSAKASSTAKASSAAKGGNIAGGKQAPSIKAPAVTKAAQKLSGGNKTLLNQEVMKAARTAGYDAIVANAVAQISAGAYGSEHLLLDVHNALSERYTDYREIYEAVKPVLSKFSDIQEGKGREKTPSILAKERNALNNEVMKSLSKAGYPNEVATSVASVVVKDYGEKNGKQHSYRNIISKYGQKQGLEIYNHIKRHL